MRIAGDSRRRIRTWLAVAAVVLVAGTISSVLGADAVAGSRSQQSLREFRVTSADVSSTLQLAIQHEEDLVVSFGAFVIGDPSSTNPQFRRWASVSTVFHRYPELEGMGYSIIVPRSQLATYEARAAADPSGPLGPQGRFQVIPPGNRPYYCFVVLGEARTPQLGIPAGLDLCSAARLEMLTARDTGIAQYGPIKLAGVLSLSISAPVYRNGTVPRTLAARRSAFLGWVGMSVEPSVLLSRAMQNHPGTAVTFRYHAGSSNVAFTSGLVPHSAYSVSTSLHNGWTVTTSRTLVSSNPLTNPAALALLISGILLSLLLSALLLVLATSRVRALRLVGERTVELRHQALHDSLTGLPNRALIMDRIDQLLARNRRYGTLGAALFVDLDEFKNVNDTLGHEAGDLLLQGVASRLTTSLRGTDTIGRMGGDEFVVLVDGASLQSAPELVAERILEVMRQPFQIKGTATPIAVTASIGVALGDRQTPGELLRDADVALYQAKANGKNCYERFRAEMDGNLQHRYELEFELRSALELGQFHLLYQPIYNLDDLTMIGVEALIRWQHPTLGSVLPDEFIPLLESSGQIVEVGRWVLIEACKQIGIWRRRGQDLMVSVNVSARQLDRDVFIDHVREALDVSGIEPAALTIEITETALMRSVDTTARRLRALKDIGVQVAIDDFGTGYSSLAYLQRFPVDCLKIDRSFTDAITRSPESDALIHTLVQLGRDLGLKTLAEGVETPGQMDHLRAERVNEAQGFLLAKPLDARTLESQLMLQPVRVGEPSNTETPDSSSV